MAKSPFTSAPTSSVDKQTVKFAKGNEITVKGSRIAFEGKPAIVAETATKGSATLVLRSAGSVSVWSGQGGSSSRSASR